MTLRIVEKITYETAQQPAIATEHDEFAIKGDALVMSAFLRHQGQQVDILRGRRRSGNVKSACEQDFLDQVVEFRDIAGQFGLDPGVGFRLEQLHAEPYTGQWRAQFVRRVSEQKTVRADQFFDPGGGTIEACRELGNLVAAFNGDPGRRVAGAERLDARLQPFDALGQAAY